MTDDTDGAGVVVCKRCGEAEGTGLACALCAQVRIARNQPREEGAWPLRYGGQQVQDGITNLLPASKDKETTMRLPMRKPGEPMPPLRREEPGEGPQPSRRGPGRPRGTGHRGEFKCPGCGAKVSGPWKCRKCAGVARRCKTIQRRAAAALEPGPHGDESRAAGDRGRMIDIAWKPIRKDAVGPVALTTPATVHAAGAPSDAPGPLTLAVCNFFGEVARASDHIEAHMTLDRRKLSITVELALPHGGTEGRSDGGTEETAEGLRKWHK